jgi:hypothetical protein
MRKSLLGLLAALTLAVPCATASSAHADTTQLPSLSDVTATVPVDGTADRSSWG